MRARDDDGEARLGINNAPDAGPPRPRDPATPDPAASLPVTLHPFEVKTRTNTSRGIALPRVTRPFVRAHSLSPERPERRGDARGQLVEASGRRRARFCR